MIATSLGKAFLGQSPSSRDMIVVVRADELQREHLRVFRKPYRQAELVTTLQNVLDEEPLRPAAPVRCRSILGID